MECFLFYTLGIMLFSFTSGWGTDVGVSSELVYQYDGPTWIENLAVRPNGLLLPATATSAVLTEISLRNGRFQTVTNESGVGNAIMGITEVVPDLFAMNSMYCDLKALSASLPICAPQSRAQC